MRFDITHLVKQDFPEGRLILDPRLKSFIDENPDMKFRIYRHGGLEVDPAYYRDHRSPLVATLNIIDEEYAVLFRMTFP